MTINPEKAHLQKAHWSEKGCPCPHLGQYKPADRKCSGTLSLSIPTGREKILRHRAGADFIGTPTSLIGLFDSYIEFGTFMLLKLYIYADIHPWSDISAFAGDSR